MSNDFSEKLNRISKSPGVYIFKGKCSDSAQGGFCGDQILYVGKATNLKNRVSSYFSGRDERVTVLSMMEHVKDIKTIETDTVLEALILEANLIKKHQPKYNILGKDDKSFSYFAITKEDFPRVLIFRETDLKRDENTKTLFIGRGLRFSKIYGPYTSKKQMETALKIIRRIFPFHSRSEKSEKGCLESQLGLCPGPHDGRISKKDYKRNIKGIQMILEGKKKRLVSSLKKEMEKFSKEEEFEKAADTRNKIFALEHIQDVALMGDESENEFEGVRVEAYDISNISGENPVGSMVVFDGQVPNKSEYRKFKIKTVAGIDDTRMMKEVILRRFRNNWSQPDLIIVDGGKGHVNMAQKVMMELKKEIPLIGVAKGPDRKKLEVVRGVFELDEKLEKLISDEKFLKRITDEAHRFAISFHRKLRDEI